MSKKIKSLIAIFMAITMIGVLCVTVCAIGFDDFSASKEDIDMERYIDEYYPDSFNQETLWVGSTDKPQSAIWLNGGGGMAVSSDEDVVTVSPSGVVTAVGSGTAYVVIIASTGMYKTYRYKVIGFASIGATIVIAIISIAALLILLIVVPKIILSSKSMGKKKLPASCISDRTFRTPSPDMIICPKCGENFDGGAFCKKCGTSSKMRNIFNIPISRRKGAQAFDKYINNWFAENPYIYDCNLSIDAFYSGSPFIAKKFFIRKASLEFAVGDTPNPKRYGYAFAYKNKAGYSSDAQIYDWQQSNRDCRIISTNSGKCGSQYYTHIFFEKI